MNYKAFTQIAIDLLPAKLCNCTQGDHDAYNHVVHGFLCF
ncbi:hypothetical protein ACP0HM_34925 [Escherichia coli]